MTRKAESVFKYAFFESTPSMHFVAGQRFEGSEAGCEFIHDCPWQCCQCPVCQCPVLLGVLLSPPEVAEMDEAGGI